MFNMFNLYTPLWPFDFTHSCNPHEVFILFMLQIIFIMIDLILHFQTGLD